MKHTQYKITVSVVVVNIGAGLKKDNDLQLYGKVSPIGFSFRQK
jgi:hypothetical protein